MSTNAACVFIEIKPDKWFYLLASPHSATADWREDAFFHGPFSSDDMAQEHLRQTYPNPGGHEIIALGTGQTGYDLDRDPLLKKRLEQLHPRLQAHGARD